MGGGHARRRLGLRRGGAGAETAGRASQAQEQRAWPSQSMRFASEPRPGRTRVRAWRAPGPTVAAVTGAGAADEAVAIDAVRVGAASWTNDLVLRRSWTRTPAVSAARSAMGTISVDLMVMGLSSIFPKSLGHLFHADREWMIPARSGLALRVGPRLMGCAAERKRGDERLTCFDADGDADHGVLTNGLGRAGAAHKPP